MRGYNVDFNDIGAALGAQAMEKVAFNLGLSYDKNVEHKGRKVMSREEQIAADNAARGIKEEAKAVEKPGRLKRILEVLGKNKGKAALGAAGLAGLGYGAYRLAKD